MVYRLAQVSRVPGMKETYVLQTYKITTVYLHSKHFQLDSLSPDLSEYWETKLKATALSLVDNDFENFKKLLTMRFNFIFGENLWGLNLKDGLATPSEYKWENGQKKLIPKIAKWKQSLIRSSKTQSGRRSWEQIAECARNSKQNPPRPSIFERGSNNAPSCFDRHATQDVKKAIKEAGKYHKWQLDMFFQWDHEVISILPLSVFIYD